MKKQYVKPAVELVDFSLSTSIANGCRYEQTNSDNSCTYLDNGWIVYVAGANCDINISESSLCYHNPSADSNIFMS